LPAVDTEKMRYRTIAVTRSVASGILVVASSVGLTGCADFYQQHRGFQDGWRTGEIVELGRANEIQRGGRTDCRKTASADQLAVQRFAILIDRSTGLDPATSLELGDIVSTNVIRCGTPIRVLSHAPALRS
jgi:hypothetical protein